jgi:hypothetical protein
MKVPSAPKTLNPALPLVPQPKENRPLFTFYQISAEPFAALKLDSYFAVPNESAVGS